MTVQQRRQIAAWGIGFLIAVALAVTVVCCTGCSSTVIPGTVESRTIAYDGDEQNAGVLLVWPGKGALITDGKKAEYDALVVIYGRGTEGHRLIPPVRPGAGLTALRGRDEGFPLHGRVWKISPEALTNFLLFKEWQRSARLPL